MLKLTIQIIVDYGQKIKYHQGFRERVITTVNSDSVGKISSRNTRACGEACPTI